jgi:hypothetical protein
MGVVMILQPYPPQHDPSPFTLGHADGDREGIPYAFTTQESLVAHFAHWFPQDWILSLIEAEKEVFVVRRECSLEETRLQFLRKCENSLLRWLHQPRGEANPEGWSGAL